MNRLKSIILHPFFQGSFIFTFLSFISNVLSYVFNLVVARLINIDQYGEYSSALSYFMVFSVPFGAMSLILVHRIGLVARKDQKAYIVGIEKALYEYIRSKIFLLTFLSVGTGLFLWLVSNMAITSILFVLSFVLIAFLMTMYQSFFLAEKEFMFAGGFLCVLALCKVIGGGVAILIHPALWFLYGVIILAHIILIILGRFHLRQTITTSSLVVRLPKLRSIFFTPSFYLPLITFLGLTSMNNIDIMSVKRFFSPEEAGLYAALSLLGRIILYVSLPLTAVAFSFFTGSDTKKNSRTILWLGIGALIVFGVLSTIGYAAFPELVVGIIFTKEYLVIAPVVWLAALFGSMFSLATLLGQYWIAQRHPVSMFSLFTAIIQAILLLLFHHSFFEVLLISLACSTVLSAIYILALFRVKGSTYGTTS